MATYDEHEEAVRQGEVLYRELPRAVSARFEEKLGLIFVELSSGYSIAFPPERAEDLRSVSVEDLSTIEITPPGWAIYFPLIDADLWVPGLAKGIFGTERWEAAWAEAHQDKQAA